MDNQVDRDLAEYQELCSSWRHDDNTFDRFSAIVLPLCFVGLIVPYSNDKADIPAILSCGVGLLGMFYWYCAGKNHDVRAETRWRRIREKECCFDFDAHRRIHNERKLYGLNLRHKDWRWLITVFYLLVAVIVCVNKHGDCVPYIRDLGLLHKVGAAAVVFFIILGTGLCLLKYFRREKGMNYPST